DGIIYGEIAPKRWMAGSDAFTRTQRDQSTWAEETADPDKFVQIAIVYEGTRITLYRDGEDYASYEIKGPRTFDENSFAVFGKRHIDTPDTSRLRGRIDDARIYGEPLSQDQIRGLKPNALSDVKPIAWWSFEEGQPKDQMGWLTDTILTGGSRIEEGCLVLEGESPIMVAAPEGLMDRFLAQASKMDDTSEEIAGQRALREIFLSDPHRPVYHFVSPEGRCYPFDPNGAIYWNGKYHLCYIFQDERGHCWGHASSEDLLHWRWHTPALYPAPGDVDTGIFSGNCFVNKDGEATMLYHGVGAGNCIATSGEPGLDHWTKLPSNPIVPIPEKGSAEEKLYSSWDPHGWLEGDAYYAIFGGHNPTIFKGQTLDDWEYVGPLLANNMPDVDDFEDVSCPDFFPIGNKQMLLCISHSRGCRYYLGEWKDEIFHPDFHARMNWPGGTCFAPESLLDDQGRRIMWAWVLDRRPSVEYGWSGTMTLPRVLSLGEDGVLRIEPVEELERLRQREKSLESIQIAAGESKPLEGIEGNAIELVATFDPKDADRFGIKVLCSPDGEEETVIEVDPSKDQIKIDVSKSSLNSSIKYTTFCMRGEDNHEVTEQVAPFPLEDGEKVTLQVFLDKSILEVFANGRQCVTQRVYPTREDSVGVAVFSEGGSATVEKIQSWEMAATNEW
ncbi:MAG: GH32 C-terminal domain-containing protein, partial [Candidatus Omnitrophica bacterium]|nr:GH32 C-terminal domain-containing protein [Candidatus Omnitrophota bacterium]